MSLVQFLCCPVPAFVGRMYLFSFYSDFFVFFLLSRSSSENYRMPVMEYKVNEGMSYEFKFPFRNNNKWQRNANKGQGPHVAQVPSQIQSPVTSRIGSGKGEGKMPPPERAANIPRSISSDGRPLESRRYVSSQVAFYCCSASYLEKSTKHNLSRCLKMAFYLIFN